MSSLFTDNNGNTNWKKIGYHARSAFAVLLSLAVLVGGGWYVVEKASSAYQAYKAEDDYQGEGGKPVQVTIEPESTGGDIANVLLDADVVKSRKAFTKAFAGNPDSQQIQAGTYRLLTQVPAEKAILMLLDKKNLVRNLLTVPEGMWASDQIALISKKTKIPAAQFEALVEDPQKLGLPSYVTSIEGYLYPETYEIGQKPTAKSILLQMTKQWEQVAGKTGLVAGAKKRDMTPNEVMTVASILEAEVPAKYQPMVAGVIYNRLEKGMRLQMDSTVHYAMKIPMNKPLPPQSQWPWDEYNTYLSNGLPPGPINAPGEVAIKAALNPTKSNYLYFVTVNFETGETKFAADTAGHNKNVAEWEAWCRTAKNKSGCPVS